jgi:hypothetical protein
VVLLPDQECAQALWLLGMHRNIRHNGSRRALAGPVHEAINVLIPSFEDRLDPAIGKVAHPPAHAVLERHPLAGITEEHTLHPAADQHPVADHNQTLRRGRPRRSLMAWEPPVESGRTDEFRTLAA